MAMRHLTPLLVAMIVASALAASAIAMTVSVTVRDTGARIRFNYTFCDPGFVGQGYSVAYQIVDSSGYYLLRSRPWHYRQTYRCEDNFFSVKDVYEPGAYFARIVVQTRDGAAKTTPWRRLVIR